MNKITRDKYIQIFALHKQGIPCHIIMEKMDCSARTVRYAVKWCLDNSLRFTSAEHLDIQIDKIRELKLEVRQKLKRLQDGSIEKTTKKHYGQEVESIERQRYNSNAEVALFRLLKDLLEEENALLGVYDACIPPEDEPPT